MITVGSLFSGIGGIELGLERTGGFKTIWQCEVDDYASAVLRKHWPGIPNYRDITKVDWTKVEKPDLVCGGFPCQDISVAGKKAGITGTRSGLWKEFARTIEITTPKWVVIENVPALVTRGLGTVLADLQRIGYQPFRPLLIEAASVGAPHKRERIFIVGHSKHPRFLTTEKPDGFIERGHNNPPRTTQASELTRPSGKYVELADSTSQRLEKQCESGQLSQAFSSVSSNGWWAVEPDVGRVANGVPSRVDRIKCLGNAVVPQVAQVIGEAIMELEYE